MKMMPPDVISHENQLQHLSESSIFMLDIFRTADHAGQIFIPHRPCPDPLNCKSSTLTARPLHTKSYHPNPHNSQPSKLSRSCPTKSALASVRSHPLQTGYINSSGQSF